VASISQRAAGNWASRGEMHSSGNPFFERSRRGARKRTSIQNSEPAIVCSGLESRFSLLIDVESFNWRQPRFAGNMAPPNTARLPNSDSMASRRLYLAMRSERQASTQFFTMSTLQWAWSLMRSAVSPSRRPHNSEWSLWPTTNFLG
jgi:hypothetical protein